MFLKNVLKVVLDFIRYPFSGGLDAPEGARPSALPPGATGFVGAEELARKLPRKPMPIHKIALWVVIVIVFLSLGIQVAMAYTFGAETTDTQNQVLGLLDWSFKAGLGAIIGLIGGKAAAESDDSDGKEESKKV